MLEALPELWSWPEQLVDGDGGLGICLHACRFPSCERSRSWDGRSCKFHHRDRIYRGHSICTTVYCLVLTEKFLSSLKVNYSFLCDFFCRLWGWNFCSLFLCPFLCLEMHLSVLPSFEDRARARNHLLHGMLLLTSCFCFLRAENLSSFRTSEEQLGTLTA